MAFKKDDRKGKQVASNISYTHYETLVRFAKMYNLPMSRLIAIAVENEIKDNDTPFKINLEFPVDEYIEHAYASEANKIYNYMKTLREGQSLDFFYILRHDIGLSDPKIFLAAFYECLQQNLIEEYVASRSVKYIHNQGESKFYRAKVNNPIVRKKILKKEKTKEQQYQEYLKLQKKFGKKDL